MMSRPREKGHVIISRDPRARPAMLAPTSSSFQSSLERFATLQTQGCTTAAMISFETQKADLYQKTIVDLEADKRSKAVRADALDRILSSLQQQMHVLREDIATGEQFTTCFTMRSLVDQQDEETDFHHDAARRDAAAEKLARRTQAVREKLRVLGEERALRGLRESLESAERPQLARYVRATGDILQLVCTLRKEQATGAEQLAPKAEELLRATQAHLAADDSGATLAQSFVTHLLAPGALAHAPAALTQAQTEVRRKRGRSAQRSADEQAAAEGASGDAQGSGGGAAADAEEGARPHTRRRLSCS